jgi:hypothetical protein
MGLLIRARMKRNRERRYHFPLSPLGITPPSPPLTVRGGRVGLREEEGKAEYLIYIIKLSRKNRAQRRSFLSDTHATDSTCRG